MPIRPRTARLLRPKWLNKRNVGPNHIKLVLNLAGITCSENEVRALVGDPKSSHLPPPRTVDNLKTIVTKRRAHPCSKHILDNPPSSIPQTPPDSYSTLCTVRKKLNDHKAIITGAEKGFVSVTITEAENRGKVTLSRLQALQINPHTELPCT